MYQLSRPVVNFVVFVVVLDVNADCSNRQELEIRHRCSLHQNQDGCGIEDSSLLL